jgi:ComF family protein
MENCFEDLLGLFYPRLCITCGCRLVTGEQYICLSCKCDLPKTQFHRDPENKVSQLFWGRVQVEYATSWLFFRKGSKYQKLVHYLKYKGLMEIGDALGKMLGQDLVASPFTEAEMIVPVPLHPRRLRQRGYNQSERIARGISSVFDRPVVPDNLARESFTSTQTRKNKFERWKNVEGIFRVERPSEFIGRHLLLIDDVVTTGATLEAAVQALLEAGAGKVSIATLAYADLY